MSSSKELTEELSVLRSKILELEHELLIRQAIESLPMSEFTNNLLTDCKQVLFDTVDGRRMVMVIFKMNGKDFKIETEITSPRTNRSYEDIGKSILGEIQKLIVNV